MFLGVEILRRRDMRKALTFTIDPADAKDFDDALSFEPLAGGGYQVGVHIADVTHYVRAGEDTDKEAYSRGTSVYLVDKVIPMLPEELCNDRCSLRPGEDKLCMSVVFEMSEEAEIGKFKICRTVIKSDFRLDYEQAQRIIDGTETEVKDQRLSVAIKTLNHMALQMRQARMAAGALDLEADEVKFRLDENGRPTDIYINKPTESNHLIEEFMLLANRTVAEQLGRTGKPSVWRVHDKPDRQKLDEIEEFKKKKGDSIPAAALHLLTVRAMAKAVYSTKNIGHYGLAFKHYTHFTSPIRRYPDMLVHRLVGKYILGERGHQFTVNLEEACRHCSECEQEAAQAERDSVKYMQAMWMQNHTGEEFTGVISGVKDFGIFVTIDKYLCDGLVPLKSLCPGYLLEYDEHNFCIRTVGKLSRRGVTTANDLNEETQRVFTLGDAVRVRVTGIDLKARHINYQLVE